MMYNIDKEKFLQFALNEEQTTTENGKFFKAIQNDITYIMSGDFAEENLLNDYRSKIEICGFVYEGKFYGVHYCTKEIDLNFYAELNAFEEKFNADYAEALKRFTLENLAPITEKTKADEHREDDFEYYCKYQAKEDAKRALFEINYNYNTSHHNEKFAPIFFDCLKHPEKYTDYIQNAIEENAHIINYRIKCEAEKEKALEILKTNTDIMYKLSIYQALKAIDGKTIKMICTLYGKYFELSIEREKLMRCLANDNNISLWNFTSTVKTKIQNAAVESGVHRNSAKLTFTDIQKITYGKKVIFEVEKHNG